MRLLPHRIRTRGAAGILLRTADGLELGNDPWGDEFSGGDRGRGVGERLNVPWAWLFCFLGKGPKFPARTEEDEHGDESEREIHYVKGYIFVRGALTYRVQFNAENPFGTMQSVEHLLRSLERKHEQEKEKQRSARRKCWPNIASRWTASSSMKRA
jgi:hypothetical protein